MKIEQRLIDEVRTHLMNYREDANAVQDAVKHSKAIYKGEPVPYLYLPRIFDAEDVETFQEATETMAALCAHVIKLYQQEQSIRDFYHFDEKLDALIRLPHYYETQVPMGRFDIFYYGNGAYQFCELNADGASAMNEEYELSKILAHTRAMRDFSFDVQPTACELFDSWVSEVAEIYADYSIQTNRKQDRNKPVNVAIVDLLDKGSPIEFEMFKEAFERAGYACKIVDARSLAFKDDQLWAEEMAIDVIYRRLVTKDLMDAYDELEDFVKGVKANAACLIGPIKTQIIHTKRFFELLYAPVLQPFLSEEEQAFIKAHVPYTAPLTRSQVFIDSKDDYIIKPVDYYASKGVCAGRDYTPSEWAMLLEDKYDNGYVVQRYCPYALVDNAVLVDGTLQMETFRHITGLFVYNGKLKGMYSRAGRNAIISGLHDGFTLSSLVAKPLPL
ncbi:glutathionylspermidine synthase family protein [Fusibacter paucivorans]|uniref:Glutathionylspermidine synthase family protein n=1 Tax=Fusibacter paucivorans TaxID=76009 RepID=A0ABS5PQZ0_9FIRM|nr:glutathionylspermidine synthase family protein [Fusibacter paucivorans]MBS7527574.1 glutathionylspermidine synthase family protein [Fusibacter paucivorans]